MVELRCLEDLPSRVLDLLSTFLAASSRGERAVLVLETKNKAINTKYRSVETEVGNPAPISTTPRRKRKNPARARRSQLRLEAFRARKVEEETRIEHQQTVDNVSAVGTSSSTTNKLVLELAKEKPLGTVLSCPTIPQVDGIDDEDRVRYSFESNYHVDDVMETLQELFDTKDVIITLESRVQTAPLSAVDIFVICLTVPPTSTRRKLSWPHMKQDQSVVFESLKKIT